MQCSCLYLDCVLCIVFWDTSYCPTHLIGHYIRQSTSLLRKQDVMTWMHREYVVKAGCVLHPFLPVSLLIQLMCAYEFSQPQPYRTSMCRLCWSNVLAWSSPTDFYNSASLKNPPFSLLSHDSIWLLFANSPFNLLRLFSIFCVVMGFCHCLTLNYAIMRNLIKCSWCSTSNHPCLLLVHYVIAWLNTLEVSRLPGISGMCSLFQRQIWTGKMLLWKWAVVTWMRWEYVVKAGCALRPFQPAFLSVS